MTVILNYLVGGRAINILIFTDAWYPQVNGVVTCWYNVRKELEKLGHNVVIVNPSLFKRCIPLPSYPEIRLPIDIWSVMSIVEGGFKPDIIHIATPEGLVGMAGKLYCRLKKLNYTTSYHTQIPEYVRLRYPIPLSLSYAYERLVHYGAMKILVPTQSMYMKLAHHGFSKDRMVLWPRGVDTESFSPLFRRDFGWTKPIMLYVGRVSVEKNIEEFLDLDINGTKVVVGGGPYLPYLKAKYRDVIFTGYKFGDELAMYYASADVFVFPSCTDTFGVVILESLASGTPVAAKNVPGPKDIIIEGVNGYFTLPLKECIIKCLDLNRDNVALLSRNWSWSKCSEIFLSAVSE